QRMRRLPQQRVLDVHRHRELDRLVGSLRLVLFEPAGAAERRPGVVPPLPAQRHARVDVIGRVRTRRVHGLKNLELILQQRPSQLEGRKVAIHGHTTSLIIRGSLNYPEEDNSTRGARQKPTQSSAPPSGRFSSPKSKPCRVRISWTSVSPRPRPSRLVLKKGVKRRGRISSGMPEPVSAIRSTGRPASQTSRRPIPPDL